MKKKEGILTTAPTVFSLNLCKKSMITLPQFASLKSYSNTNSPNPDGKNETAPSCSPVLKTLLYLRFGSATIKLLNAILCLLDYSSRRLIAKIHKRSTSNILHRTQCGKQTSLRSNKLESCRH